MSRWMESGVDEHGRRYYREELADAEGCRHLINEVCCNEDNDDMMCVFPFAEECGREHCRHFEAETAENLEALKDGRVYYD